MEKLELKHLAPYLAYGLRVLNKINSKVTVCDLTSRNIDDHLNEKSLLILRPLSDLTKDIEHNVEKFVPQKRIPQLEFEWLITSEKPYELVQKANYEHFIKLIEWHFDVFGLIDKGLAIDINTLKNE